jgi:hypothetical protein
LAQDILSQPHFLGEFWMSKGKLSVLQTGLNELLRMQIQRISQLSGIQMKTEAKAKRLSYNQPAV